MKCCLELIKSFTKADSPKSIVPDEITIENLTWKAQSIFRTNVAQNEIKVLI